MNLGKLFLAIALLCGTLPIWPTSLWGADRPRLLPEPQSIQYGAGRIEIARLAIRFASAPSPEDRFAAAKLARSLSQRTGIPVPIGSRSASGPMIMIDRTGPIDALPVPGEQPGPESRESYRLKVTPDGIRLSGRSSAAIYYGVQTLLQLAEGEGRAAFIPEVDIHDWPSLAYRGTLVDVGSEGPMCTEVEIERQLDFLAKWKANQYYLYSETSIELDGYPLLSADAHFTKDEVRRIVAYGRARHIDVIPALELYGHLHNLFRIEKYSDLADSPHGGEFDPASPKVKALLKDWISQLAELFPSPFVVIGFDETWNIQKAAQRSGVNATPVQLFVSQMLEVTSQFHAQGKHVMAYADIMVKFPEIISELPPDLIAIPWYYDPSPDPEYKRWLQPLVAKEVPEVIASGVSSWAEIAPDFDRTFANIDTFLAAGRKVHTLGLINTVWTDDGQMLMRMSWPGMAYGAIASWQPTSVEAARFFSDYARIMYPHPAAPEVAEALIALNASEVRLQKVVGRETMKAVWQNPFGPATLESVNSGSADLRQCRLLAEDSQEHLSRALSLGGDSASLADLVVGARLLDYTAMKYIYASEIENAWAQVPKTATREQLHSGMGTGIYNQVHSRMSDLMDGITQLRKPYEAAWLAQYTDYRLRSALGRWDAEYEYWRRVQARFDTFVTNFHDGEALPSLEDLIQDKRDYGNTSH